MSEEEREGSERCKLTHSFYYLLANTHSLPNVSCRSGLSVAVCSAWTGMFVPSKFFGALAAGRPVLFAGSSDSSAAQWIREIQLGVSTGDNLGQVSEQLSKNSCAFPWNADPA